MMSTGFLDAADTVQVIQESDVILLSLDAPLDKVQKVLDLARKHSTGIVINASPPVSLPLSVLRGQGRPADRGDVDFVIATSREARDWLELLGTDVSGMSDDEVAETIQEAGAKNVVITSDDGRCVVVSRNTIWRYEPLEEQKRRPNNGARSAFCAALAVRYAELQPSPEGLAGVLDDIIGFAAAARVSVLMAAARIDALPRRADVDDLVRFEPKVKLAKVEPRKGKRPPPTDPL
jgi:sugar/nucleoside kinase (ribokinase family)